MKTKTKSDMGDRIRKYIFFGIVLICVLVMVVEGQIASSQDEVHQRNYTLYQDALQADQQQDFAKAARLFGQLDNVYKNDSPLVQWNNAIAEAGNGNYTAASQHMDRARELRPALVLDVRFDYQYGMIMTQLGDYEQAEAYLNQAGRIATDPAIVQEIDRVLGQIKIQNGENQ